MTKEHPMAPTKLTDHTGRPDEGLRKGTGKSRDEWYARLDEWGATGRSYREIADWLTGQGMSDWWAQKTIVEYEQARGTRGAGARRDGTFSAGASKTIAVPSDRVLAAFSDEGVRASWLPDVALAERTSTPGKRARFDVADGTRLSVELAASGDGRCQVAVEQDKLPSAERAATQRAYWRDRLEDLKALLER
jgi:hypothetical protein